MNENFKTNLADKIEWAASIKCMEIDLGLLGIWDNKPFLFSRDVADFFKTDLRTLYNWRKNRGLKARKVANEYRYMWSDILEFLENIKE